MVNDLNPKYMLHEDGTIESTDDLMKWAHWMENNQGLKRIKTTQLPGHLVSTVFLGIDHNYGSGPPILFETMNFTKDGWDQPIGKEYQLRAATKAESVKNHWYVVCMLMGWPLIANHFKYPGQHYDE